MLPSLLELTSELIGIPSVSGDQDACRAVVEFCKTLLQKLPNVEVREYERNGNFSLVALYKADKEPNILLQGHLDVVPAPNKCFRPEIQDGLLLGRGAYDMKGHVAAIMHCFEAHVLEERNASLGLMLTTDEEVGGHDGVKYLVEKEGYKPKCVILPDGGQNFKLVTRQLGIIWAKVTHKGIAAHASRPEEGHNAILSFMHRFEELQRKLEHLPDTIVTLATIEAGTAYNVTPGLCTAGIDIRSTDVETVFDILQKTFTQEELMVLQREPAFIVDTTHPALAAFQEAASHITGFPLPEMEERGASDARFFAPYNIPVILTASNGGDHHKETEWVEIKSLHTLEKIINRFLTDYKSI